MVNNLLAHFQRPHHDARQSMEDLIITLFKDDMDAIQHTPPDNQIDWPTYYDWVFTARLDLIGEGMDWEAPVYDDQFQYDEKNIALANQWKKTYHVMRAIMLAEITNQVMASERFNHLLDEYGDTLKAKEAPPSFNRAML